jgi:WD40 repeat protein
LAIQPWFSTEITSSALTVNSAMTSGDAPVAARSNWRNRSAVRRNSINWNSKRPAAACVASAVPMVASTAIQDANEAPTSAAAPPSPDGHTLAFAPDGRTLATASSDQTVLLWDVTDPARPRRLGDPLTGHTTAVMSVAFTPDGNTLVTANLDETVLLWDLTGLTAFRNHPTERACSITRGGLDPDQWARNAPDLAYEDSCAT